jgi:hypothetical protein
MLDIISLIKWDHRTTACNNYPVDIAVVLATTPPGNRSRN